MKRSAACVGSTHQRRDAPPAAPPPLAELSLSPSASPSAALLDGFLRACCSQPVLSALVCMEQKGLHPIGAGEYSTLEYTLAGGQGRGRQATWVHAAALCPAPTCQRVWWVLRTAHAALPPPHAQACWC